LKVLAIIGSPRKGNTYKIVQQIEEHMKKCGDDIVFQYVFLKDAHLEMCKGCFACLSKGENFCPIKDDMTKIKEEMLSADGVILASPGYVFTVSALMKNFIDRLAHVCHRPCFFGKYVMVVTTSCGGGIPETLKYLEDTARTWGFTFASKLGVMQHPAVKPSEKTMAAIEKSSKEFYTFINLKKTATPRLRDLLQFRIMKVNAMESRSHFASDYDFYKDRKDYYTDVKINILKNKLAQFLEKLILKMMGSNA
jgi:multimeric flavodoxin WrbA